MPRGYYGDDHTILGSDILAGLKILKLPDQVLGPLELERMARVKPDGWYPVKWLMDLTEVLEAHVGRYGLMQMGRRVFEMSHKQRVSTQLKNAKELLYALDGMYHNSNRGRGIGGFQVLRFEPGVAEIEKNTPQHCLVDQGMLTEALLGMGCACNVSQIRCFREGADTCVYEITSAFVDKRWSD
jgi:hypothetical protein